MITYITWSVVTIGVIGGSLLVWGLFWWKEWIRPLIMEGVLIDQEIDIEMLKVGIMRLNGENPAELLEGVEARYEHLNKILCLIEDMHTKTLTGRVMKYILRRKGK